MFVVVHPVRASDHNVFVFKKRVSRGRTGERKRERERVCVLWCALIIKQPFRQGVTVFTAPSLLADIHRYLCVITLLIIHSQTTRAHRGTRAHAHEKLKRINKETAPYTQSN